MLDTSSDLFTLRKHAVDFNSDDGHVGMSTVGRHKHTRLQAWQIEFTIAPTCCRWSRAEHRSSVSLTIVVQQECPLRIPDKFDDRCGNMA